MIRQTYSHWPNPSCAAMHLGGPWCADPHWLRAAVSLFNSGQLPEIRAFEDDDSGLDSGPREPYHMAGPIAVIPVMGSMSKGGSKFGGTSTVGTRQALRQAVADESVRGIMLHIESPGGTAAGTPELAAEIARAGGVKPIRAHIEDMGASAAYWAASATDRITANATAQVGSIGTVAVLEDLSGAAAQAGIKVHVISTGPLKGAGTEGTEITPEVIGEVRELVDGINAHFLAAVSSGRGLTDERLDAVTTGGIWLADRAQALGLIDGIADLESALGDFAASLPAQNNARNEVRANILKKRLGG